MAIECFRLLQKLRRFQILLIVSLILVISAYLFAVYGWNSRDSFLAACGQYVIPLVMVPLYFIACMEADHVVHLQSVQVRRDRTGRKMDQFVTEMLILAEYMALYLVLPVMIAGLQSPMISWFLASSLCMMLFAGALRLMMQVQYGSVSGSSDSYHTESDQQLGVPCRDSPAGYSGRDMDPLGNQYLGLFSIFNEQEVGL